MSFFKRYFAHFSFFYKYLGKRIFIALLLSLVVGVLDGLGLSMFFPLLKIVDDPSSGNLGSLGFIIDFFKTIGIPITIVSVLILLVVFFILKGIMSYVLNTYLVVVQQFFLRLLRIHLIQLLNGISFKSFITTDIGRIQNTLTAEIERLSNAYKGYFETMKAAILVIVYMVFAFLMNPQFAILVVIGGALTNVLYRKVYMNTKQASRKLTIDSNFFQGQIIQYITNFKYLKATGSLELYSEKLEGNVLHIEQTNRRIGKMTAILIATREPMMIIVVATILYIQVVFMGGKIGALLVSLLFFYRALSAVMLMQSQWNFFIAVSGSMENVTALVNEFSDQQEPILSTETHGFKNEIKIQNLNFSYNENEYQLSNINLVIPKNSSIAFVGGSGSGKTTLVNLIAGLLPYKEGSICVDKLELAQLNKLSFQHRIGYITQEPVIFNDTVYNNVTFWSPKTADNLVRFQKAIEQASLSDLIQDMSEKEDTQLGNNGVNISGGQKQRISIARELFKEIDILIMDEATSALDSETEKAIQESIDAIKGKYTIVIIAHRLSTIRNVDQVVLMEKGRIEAIDTFDDLVASNEKFKRMVELQEI